MIDNKLSLLEKLAELEITVNNLYSAYAINFLNFKDFWSGLADEEKQHSKWVKQLQDLVISGQADFRTEVLTYSLCKLL
ncbi:MAG TPA: hypothetical protein VEH58_07035 [Dehalococcoidales bacterium]|nr:hypothetical protein [Dehalococcoidales bacterium]